MFSGIVEEYATVVALVKDQENIHFSRRRFDRSSVSFMAVTV